MTTEEAWRAVVTWEGSYEVSDQGRARSVERRVPRGNSTMRIAARVLSTERSDRYPTVTLRRGERLETIRVHVLVLKAFVGPCPLGMEGCHEDDDPDNNALTNLRWDTREANQADRVRNGGHYLANRTHCPRAHLLALPNLVAAALAKGHRSCLACNRAFAVVAAAAKRGEVLDLQTVSDAKYREIMETAA